MKKIIPIALSTWLVSASAVAGDITREIQQGDSYNGSFSEFGISLQTSQLPLIGFTGQVPRNVGDTVNSLSLDLWGRLEYKGFFAEAIKDSFSNFTLGYTVKNDDSYSLDLILSSNFEHIERDEYEGFESITDRDSDVSLGFRSSFHRGDSIFHYELVSDVSGAHAGVMASVQYGKQYQYRNWNLHSLLGVRYFSDNVLDHYFGVSAAESTASLPRYRAKKGFMPSVMVGATLPLNEKWIFKSNAEYAYLPDSVTDSPLAPGDDYYVVQAGFYRVLYPR